MSIPLSGAPACTPFDEGGIHLRCNISYDATIPSEQAYARTIAGIWNPAGNDGGPTPCTVLLMEGKGWNGVSENFATDLETAADHLVLQRGCAVYSLYYSWPVGMQVTEVHSAGETSIVVRTILNDSSQGWFPNAAGCVDDCAGISVPFTALYGTNGTDQETVIVTGQGGTSNYTLTIDRLVNNHAANEYLYIPKTEWPAPLADLISFLNWAGAHMGRGAYPGNPMDIQIWAVSSGAHLAAMASQVSPTYCLVSCPASSSWWGNTIGFNGGSSNSAANWRITSELLVSMPWDLNFMMKNATSGSPASTLVQSAVPALLGCVPGTDAGCTAFATTASPVTLTPAQLPGPVLSTSGTLDFTTPVCAPPETWAANAPCVGNMYQLSGRPFLVFSNPPDPAGSIGHGSDCFTNVSNAGGCWPLALTFLAVGNGASSNLSASPSTVSFPNQTVNTTSGAHAITVTNYGPDAATISEIAVTGADRGDFAQTNNCTFSPETLAVNASCTIDVTFHPSAASVRSAAVSIVGNANSPSVVLSGTGVGSSSTWPDGYTYKATFIVAADQVPSAQTNFPALISGTYADFATTANGGRISNTCTQTVGNNATLVPCDLIFTSDAAGTMLLNWEFETWTPTTGAVNLWVNAPSLSNGTIIYAWYGQPSVTTLQTTPSAAWSSNFMAVYHLKENPAGTAPQLNDSTANGNNATMNGTVLASQQQPGQIDGSINFESDTWASLANPANFSFERTDSFSLSGWFNIQSNSAGTLMSKLPASPSAGWALLQFPASAAPAFSLGLFGAGSSTLALAETPVVTTGAWHYVVATYSGTGTVAGMHIYVDGVNQPLSMLGNNLATSIVNTVAPTVNGRAGPNQMSTDSMDEIRISTKGVVFTPAYVTATFNNQRKLGTFFNVVTGLTKP